MIEFYLMPPDFFDPIPEQQLSFSLTLPHFVIRRSTGEYLTKVRIVSNYVEYQFTTNRDEAYVLNFFFQAEDGIRDLTVTGVQTCALPICLSLPEWRSSASTSAARSPTRCSW